jgi:hypothetical protein
VVFACLAWDRLLPSASRWRAGLAAAGTLELALVALSTAPTLPADVYRTTPSAVADLAALPRDASGAPPRFFATTLWLWPSQLAVDAATRTALLQQHPPGQDLAMRYGLYAVEGHGEPQFAWQDAVFRSGDLALMSQFGARRLYLTRPASGLPALGRHGPALVYDNPGALPRALVVQRVEAAADPLSASLRSRGRGFDVRGAAVVEGEAPASRAGRGSAQQVSDVHDRSEWEVRTDGPAWLLVHDTWAPGWSARVDGAGVPIHRANGTFRLVPVPEGTSRVVFEYVPPGLRPGAWLSAATLAVLLTLLACGWLRGRRRPRPTSAAT